MDTFASTQSILRNEGWRALYQGLSSSVIGASTAWGLYFFIYNSSKNYFVSHGYGTSDRDLSPPVLLASSLNAGITTCLVTHPMFLVKTRLQLQQKNLAHTSNTPMYRGTFDALWKIATREGIGRGLYVGITPSLLLISHGVINFVLYDIFKQYYLRVNQLDTLNSYESFLLAAPAKSIAALATYPLQVIKTRLQDYKNKSSLTDVRYNGMWDAMIKMYRMEGVGSFFRGIIPHALRVTPSGAITFTIFEFIMNMLTQKQSENKI
jgi:solute carrier family 25 folate transporter 32